MIPTPGNYPQPVWDLICKIIKGEKQEASLENFEIGSTNVKIGYLILLDIHNFSKFCDEREGEVIELLKQFYLFFSKHISAFNDKKGGNTAIIYKYIGDAILFASFKDNIKELIDFGNKLIKLYKEHFIEKYPLTNLAILISKIKCYEGLVLGDRYSDYSLWGKNINFSFKCLKRYDFEGKVAITPEVLEDLNNEYRTKFKPDGVLVLEEGG